MLSGDDSAVPFVAKTKSDESTNDTQTMQKSKQIKSLPFIYFIVGAILSIVCGVLYIIDNSIGFFISGIIGIIICMFGLKHFKTLINLKIEIDEFSKLNLHFHKEHNGVKHEVDRLSAANTTLSDTQNRLKISNQKHRDNLVIFRGIQYNMEQFNAESMEELKDILGKVSSIERKWYEELFSQQRHLLHTVFDRFCSYQSHVGMTETEFKQFTDELPVSYQERFARMGTFKHLAGNKSVILLEDFANTLDVFAEMQTSDVDIEFELQPTKTKRKMHPKRSLQQRKTQYLSNIDRLSILAAIGEDNNDDRKYDNDSLIYESQIVITKRSNTIKATSPGVLGLELSALTPFESTPVSPYGGRVSPYYKVNRFEYNERITDRSSRNIVSASVASPATPILEEMNILDIANRDFTNKQIDKYMRSMQLNQLPETESIQ